VKQLPAEDYLTFSGPPEGDGDAVAQEVVELRVVADAAQLPLLRAVATNVAGRQDFDLDAIADITMAVDELCSLLIADAVRGAMLDCRFRVRGEALHIEVSAPSATADLPAGDTFGWHVLCALGDAVNAWAVPVAAWYAIHIDFIKNNPYKGHDR